MSHYIKPAIIALFALTAIAITTMYTNKTTARWTENELDYALRVATQDATSLLMDDSFLFEEDEEPEDFRVDLETASAQFERSFRSNIGSTIDSNFVNKMNVTLSGYVGYKYVYGIYGSGYKTVPFGYSYSDATNLYEFTLGNKVYVTNRSTGEESTLDLSTLTANYFDDNISNKNFRNITVMNAVNDFLNVFYEDDANITATNAGSGIRFELGHIDYAEASPSVMTKISSIIDGPSFFAVVDIMDTRLDNIDRVVSIGAAELKSLY